MSSNPPLHELTRIGKFDDHCAIAIRHYEAKDLSSSDIVKMFEQAARNHDVRATMWLARFYNKGRCSLPIQPVIAQQMANAAIPEIEVLAKKGDTEAQFLLGSAYQEGLGLSQELKKAVAWYSKAINGGHITAMNNLGVMLAHGHGTEPDINKARLLFTRAAAAGSRRAQDNLTVYGGHNRDDTQRLQALRSVLLVRILGMQKDNGIGTLVKSGLISNRKNYIETNNNERNQYYFRADGIFIDVDINGRIRCVEGHAKGPGGEGQFRGDIPFGLAWDTRAGSALKLLGTPDDQGNVESDKAYGLAYYAGNVVFAAMFFNEPPSTLKVWPVYEKWAVK